MSDAGSQFFLRWCTLAAMDHQAIESRLRDEPSDVSAWQAYGQWLAQKGDARGQIIHLSLQRANAPASSARYRALGEEMDRVSAEFKSRPSRLPKGAKAEFQYGFLVGLQWTLHEGTVEEIGPFLSDLDHCLLRSLRFVPAEDEAFEDEDEEYEEGDENKPPEPVHADAASALAALDLRNIRSIGLPYCVIGAEGVKGLLSSKSLGQLDSLDLRYSYIADEGANAIANCSHLADLRSLWLQRNAITSKGIRSLARSAHLRKLELLDLRYNAIGSKGAQELAGSPIVTQLKLLHLFRDEIKKGGAQALANSTQLPVALRRMWRAS